MVRINISSLLFGYGTNEDNSEVALELCYFKEKVVGFSNYFLLLTLKCPLQWTRLEFVKNIEANSLQEQKGLPIKVDGNID